MASSITEELDGFVDLSGRPLLPLVLILLIQHCDVWDNVVELPAHPAVDICILVVGKMVTMMDVDGLLDPVLDLALMPNQLLLIHMFHCGARRQ